MKQIKLNKLIATLIMFAYWGLLIFFQSLTYGIKFGGVLILVSGLLGAFITYMVLKFLSPFLMANKDDKNKNKNKVVEYKTKKIKYGLVIAIITFIIFAAYWRIQYNVDFSPDIYNQYSQAIGEKAYNDWHPVLHTIMFFTIPSKICNNLHFISFMQIIYFSIAFGYLMKVLNKNSCPKIIQVLSCLVTWFHPFMYKYIIFPWKDMAFMIFAIVVFAYYIEIICSKGKWLKDSRVNCFLFALFIVLCSFMRHNAILFTLPLLVIALTYIINDGKKVAYILASIILLITTVKCGYKLLNVEKPGSRTIETVGLPLTVWSNVAMKNMDAMPAEFKEFMYKMAPSEVYRKYDVGSFNSIKYDNEIALEVIEELSYGQVLKMTIDCFRYAPIESFEALSKLTNIVWGFDVVDKFPTNSVSNLIKRFTQNVGIELLSIAIIGCLLMYNGRKSFIHLIPLFCYNFGTMLLLTGNDFRFFLFTVPLWFATIFIMLKDESKFKNY